MLTRHGYMSSIHISLAFTKIILYFRVDSLPFCLFQLVVLHSSAALLCCYIMPFTFYILYAHFYLCAINVFLLELILGHKHGDFGDVSPQLVSPLHLAHLHLGLQSDRSLHGAHQHQLTCHTV